MPTNNPAPPRDPKIRRQMIPLTCLSAVIMLVLLGSMLAFFSKLFPAWVSAASCTDDRRREGTALENDVM